MSLRRPVALALAATSVAMLLAGCIQDAICGSDDYPVLQTGGTGRQCVPSDQDPPAGFSRFPEGQEPKHVDDEWDVYWRTHTVDQSGKTISA
ncbi:hypothetical protein JIG36_09935 [Actinoplanes sp. LDG1-06]|uniref:Lipoprotein n=1 Tax=Paractinoplanes ovalisporus TaxID=2810368 RepID=A0ABS2A828_9ACTN|nr:hypothetical protein [Actinoplanes ovalisporus]MBM2615875.1 hypothetical protein [Actinoplanes ovalisporus]